MALRWSLERGAKPEGDDAVRFTVWAPRARDVRVRLCNGRATGDHRLDQLRPSHDEIVAGLYTAVVPGASVGDDYTFVLDGNRERPDPASRWQPHGVHGPSRIVEPRAFAWTDREWRGISMADLVIYELHVGTFTPEGTLDAVETRLASLKALGISAIELMPLAQFPGDRNWGYDGVGLYAVQNSYGGPDALRRLADAAHATGLGVMLDVVYNHLGPEGNYLDDFGPYFTDSYRTPWGRALNYDGHDSDEVRRFVIDNARYWIQEYHIDGLRLDAVHGIFDFGARHVLAELAEAVHADAADLGRSVVVIAESDLNDPKLIAEPEEHGFGLDGQWSDDFHHAVHAALTGERAGYYADFGHVSHVADALREPFVLGGRYSVHRRRRHGASSAGVPRRRFVVAIQNHDQVGNRANGDRLSTLLDAAELRLAAALLILSPYVPLIFMGDEYGESNPFLYFVSHTDPQLAEAVRNGRRNEFRSFGWHNDVPDPQAPETFERSKLDWPRASGESNARILALYRDLLALRREEPLLHPDAARISVASGEPGWITLLRESGIGNWASGLEARESIPSLLAVFNCAKMACDVPVPGPAARAWTLRLSTDAIGYGGTGALDTVIPGHVDESGPRRLLGEQARTLQIPPSTAAVFSEA